MLPYHKEKTILPLCCPNTFVTKQDGYNITCPLNDTLDHSSLYALDKPRVCESSAWTVKELESIPKDMEGRNYCFGPSFWPVGKELSKTKLCNSNSKIHLRVKFFLLRCKLFSS